MIPDKTYLDIERNTLFLLSEELKRFKKEKGLKDFNDLIEDFLLQNLILTSLPINLKCCL